MKPRRTCVCLTLALAFGTATDAFLSTTTRSRPPESTGRRPPLITDPSSFATFAATTTTSVGSESTENYAINSDEQVLNVLEQLGVDPPWGKEEPIISTLTFNIILKYILQSSSYDNDNRINSNSGELAESILRYMIRNKRKETQPDLISLNTVLAIYAKNSSTPRDANTNNSHRRRAATAALPPAIRADELRREWETVFYERKWVKQNIDRVSLNTVMSAFVRAGSVNDARRIFAELQVRYDETKDDNMKPDAVSYATLLRGYANIGRVRDAEALFQTMKQQGPNPTIECFNEVLYAYSKSSLPGRAEEFLKVWMEDDKEVVRPDVRSYNTVLHALSNNKDPSAILRAELLLTRMPVRDATSYTTYIYLCNRLLGHMALDATKQVLEKASNDEHVTMDASFVSNVLYSISNCDDRDMPVYAESLMENLIKSGQQASVGLYNALLHCWAKSADRDAGRRARSILARMQEDPALQPDTKTYTNVLDCLAKSREPEAVIHAEEIVDKMEREGPEPTTQTYTTLIQNYARSRLPLKAVKAAEVLRRMKETERANARPTIVTYNAVLNAAEHTDSSDLNAREEALKVACITFDEIRNNDGTAVKPTHVTYGIFFGVLTNLMPSELRQHIVSLVFRRCCLDGQVSYLVLKKLKPAVQTRAQYKELLMGYQENGLPDEWTCNVRDSKARNT